MHKDNWSLEEWLEHDPEGLNDLQSSNPLKFDQLNASYFGANNINGNKGYVGNKTDKITPTASLDKNNWSLEEWLENDPKGLNDLQRSNPLKFEQLNAAYYGEIKKSNSEKILSPQISASMPNSKQKVFSVNNGPKWKNIRGNTVDHGQTNKGLFYRLIK